MRAVLAWRSPALYPDGVVELENARAIGHGDWTAVLESQFHPLYALLVAGLDAITSGRTPTLDQLGQVVAVLGSALVAPALAGVAWLLVPLRARKAALVAGVLAACHPYLVRFGGEVLAHGLSHGILAVAALFLALAVERRSVGWAVGAGLAVGVGYTARTDVLVSGFGLGLGLCLLALLPGDERRRRLLLPVGFLLGTLVGMAPYALAIRGHSGEWRLTLKKRTGSVLRAPLGPRGGVKVEKEPTLAELVDPQGRGAPAHPPGLAPSTGIALRVAFETAFPSFVLLAALGLFLRDPFGNDGRAPPLAWPLVCAAATFVAVQALLKANWNTTDKIHQAPLAVLVVPLATRGLLVACDRLAFRFGLPHRILLAVVTGILLLAGPLPKALAVKKAHQVGDRELGEWLRADWLERNGPVGRQRVSGLEARPASWYARATWIAPPRELPAGEALQELRKQGCDTIIIYERGRGALDPERVPKALAPFGLTPARPPVRAERSGRSYLWWAFHLGEEKR